MRWLVGLFLIFAAPAGAGGGQPPVLEPEMAPPIATLLYDDYETRMTVPVEIAGAGPFRFVIDTGAQRTVISRQLAGQLGLPAGRTVRLTAMSGTSMVGTAIIPSLSVSVLGGERIEAPMLEASHLGAPGMLGIDTLQGHALDINFETQTMAISPARKRGTRPPRQTNEIVVRAKSLFGQLVVTDAYVGKTRVRVILDTGTSVSMGNEALRKRLIRDRRGEPVRMLSVTGGMVDADYTTLSNVKIGGATVVNLPIAIADAAPFRIFGVEKRPAILLGMDALRLFRRVQIDFANRELRLELPRDAKRETPNRYSVSSGH